MTWFLAFAIVASGATKLRDRGEVGLGELPYSIWLVIAFLGLLPLGFGRKCWSWTSFVIVSSLALTLGLWHHPQPQMTLLQQLKPGLAWVFASSGAVLLSVRQDVDGLGWRFAAICLSVTSGCWLLASFVPTTREYFYFRDYRFSALCANPNQTALFFLCLPWLVGQKWWLLPWIVWLGLSTGSDSLLLGWTVGAAYSLWERPKDVKWPLVLALGLLLWWGLSSFQRPPADFVRLESARENVTTRTTLALHGIQAWSVSPWVGWGPGAYSGEFMPFEAFEAHNSWVDWATNAGLIGLLAYLQLVFYHGRWLARRRRLSPFLALLVFSTFQYTFRQPIFWMSWWLCASEGDPSSEEARGEK